MSEDLTFTERAKDWVRDQEPSPELIERAYKKMLVNITKVEGIDMDDADECLQYLLEAYQGLGQNVDTLLVLSTDAQSSSSASTPGGSEPRLDATPLYSFTDTPVVDLPPEVKRSTFEDLKQRFGKMA